MNLGESLRKLIKENINSSRPFFGYVVKQNGDKTWVVQPVDDGPVVNNVQTFQTDVDGNDPIIGSLVLCIFIDDYNSFITEIIEWSTWYVNADKSAILGSGDISVIHGKRVYLDSTNKTTEELKTYIENNPNLFGGADDKSMVLSTNGALQLSSFEDGNETNVSFIRLNNKSMGDDYGMIVDNLTNLRTLVQSKSGLELVGGNIELKEILLDMLSFINKINAAISTAGPTTQGVPYTGAPSDTTSITSKLNTFTGN